jgi:vacuolar-type H+-ATPase subunit I/STV1
VAYLSLIDDSALLVMKTKLVLKVAGLMGVLALISAGYCFWLMTVPLSYDWVPVVLIGFIVATGVFVISLITLFIALIRLRRSRRGLNTPQIGPT